MPRTLRSVACPPPLLTGPALVVLALCPQHTNSEELELPKFLNVLKEVTHDDAYSMYVYPLLIQAWTAAHSARPS